MSAFDQETSHVEICLLTIKECFVYKVPPLRTASGHRAEDWNLATPLFTGCLKLFQGGNALRLVIYTFKDPKKTSVTDDNIQTFGECPIVVKPGENILNFVDAVIDSSRYYVVRIKDPNSSRTTLLGVGFRERDDAFDLKNSLNDYVKFINRMDLASQLASTPMTDFLTDSPAAVGAEAEDAVDGAGGEYISCRGEKQDVAHAANAGWNHIPALKEGEKIKISIGKGKHTHEGSSSAGSSAGGAGGSAGGKGGFLLKPPPPAGSVVHYGGGSGDIPEATPKAAPAAATAAEDDWGDFA